MSTWAGVVRGGAVMASSVKAPMGAALSQIKPQNPNKSESDRGTKAATARQLAQSQEDLQKSDGSIIN